MPDAPDIFVTAYFGYRASSDDWAAYASGGNVTPMEPEIVLTMYAPGEQEVKDAFVAEWNARAGTSWEADQFDWIRDDDRFVPPQPNPEG